MAIFKRTDYADGGFHDKGKVYSHYEAESEKELRKKLNIFDGYSEFEIISAEEYAEKKRNALKDLQRLYPI
jgi:hypothetical protein